jgi:hypothetical protein
LHLFPRIDDLVNIVPTDLLGNGTACLVWSSPLSRDTQRPMRYVNLMGGLKPHLLIKTIDNLGAETRVRYAPSTKFYLQDQRDGRPWITRLPFPVHVVERVETYDHISRNRFVTRYAYHHGYFDGNEREFRGFGMVEQWDTEEYAALAHTDSLAPAGGEGWGEGATNLDASSHVPPVLTKTWYHTGAYLGRNHISDFFAGLLDANDIGEYYRESGLTDAQARSLLLQDTVIPVGLSVDEEREACRALKGAMLRQEVYALDGTDKEAHPYTVTEQNFTIRRIQPKASNRYAVFFTHAREVISYHYERNPADPRISHAITLEVDTFGNVLKEAAIGYGRRETIHVLDNEGRVTETPNPALEALEPKDQAKQTQTLVTYTENRVTNAIEAVDNYRVPLPCEARSYELTGYTSTGAAGRFQISDFVQPDPADPNGLKQLHLFDGEVDYADAPPSGRQRRLIEQLRTLYRPDDLGVLINDPLALLPLGTIEPLAQPGETYNLAFTPNLLAQVYQRNGQPLLTDPVNLLGGQGPDQGGYVDLDNNDHWWIPSGRMFYSPAIGDSAAQELAHARMHFFMPHRYRDPFDQTTTVAYDPYDLLLLETEDALGNRDTVGERDAAGNITLQGNDYRVLQPRLVMDPNRNRSVVAFDTLGMVVGTAVMGKPEEDLGDSLDTFVADLAESDILDHLANPLTDPHTILGRATTRLVYDLFAYQHSKDMPDPQPAVVYTLARVTHDSDLETDQQTRIQHSFTYSDGFGREIQKKSQAEPGPLAMDDPNAPVIDPRWVGSGWTIFNNKGKPVRQYEPFFDDTHEFRFGKQVGVSPILFYDPAERVVATLHPNHTWEKVVFDPWRQEAWDVNDTVTQTDPRDDPDVGNFFQRLPDSDYLPTWYDQRNGGALGPEEQDAASKAADHANTPAVACLDTLGRTFLTIADNGSQGQYPTRVELDIEGNTRWIDDARGNRVMEYAYSMAGPEEEEEAAEEEAGDEESEEAPDSHLLHQNSMDAGERWFLYNAAGNLMRKWDSQDRVLRYRYDALQRDTHLFVQQGTATKILAEQTVYGESLNSPESLNLRDEVYQQFDGAGVITQERYDFKGNLLESTRQLAVEYDQTLDWSSLPALEEEVFTTTTAYDALDRVISSTTPDTSTIYNHYNEASLLDRITTFLRGAEATTTVVANIDYNAKGQRTAVEYGNGVRTTYLYDPDTFRLTRLKTVRYSDNAGLQDLNYTYDPVGNIVAIRDDAQQTFFYANAVITPNSGYEYDPLYRLIKATGREHIGQNSGPPDHADPVPIPIPHPNDINAFRRYIESYEYDAVDNILLMKHEWAGGRWLRRYQYATDSNRLLSTSLPGDPDDGPYSAIYDYDSHGNMDRMPHLPSIHWDYADRMQETERADGSEVFYVYEAGGERVRKVFEHNGATVEERIYLGGFEIYRKRNGSGPILERESLHVMDDEKRIALVETKTNDQVLIDSPVPIFRYQLDNHLGSSILASSAKSVGHWWRR